MGYQLIGSVPLELGPGPTASLVPGLLVACLLGRGRATAHLVKGVIKFYKRKVTGKEATIGEEEE